MNTRKIIAGLVVAAAVAGGGYFLYDRFAAQPDQKPPAPAAPARETNVLRYGANAPQLAYIEAQKVMAYPEPLLEPLNGRIAYDENYTARVSSPIAGRVVKIEVQPGDSVTKGQALATLDAPEYGSAIADNAKTQAELRQKQLAFARAKTLFEGEVLARKDFEAAQADLQEAQAEFARTRGRLANLNQAKIAPGGKFALRAPISGVVAERRLNPGQEVRTDAPDPLFTITDPTHLWVILDLPERDLGKVKVGGKAAIEVDAFPGERFAERFVGRIAAIGETLDPATRRIQVRITVDNPKRLLKPEMYARVTPLADGQNRLLRIPNSAVISEGLQSFVFVETAAGVFEKRRVAFGLQNRDNSYVKEGLKEGDQVVVNGALLLNSELSSVES